MTAFSLLMGHTYSSSVKPPIAATLLAVTALAVLAFFGIRIYKILRLTPKKDGLGLKSGLVLICVMSAYLCLVMVDLWSRSSQGLDLDKLRDKEAQYLCIACKTFAAHVSSNHPGEKLLWIRNAEHGQLLDAGSKGYAEWEKQMVELLERDFDTVRVVSVPFPGEPEFEDRQLTAARFDQLLKEYRDCSVVLCTAQLPDDFMKMERWAVKILDDLPALYLSGIDVDKIKGLLQSGHVKGVLVEKDTFEFDLPVPDDDAAAFDLRYDLVTPETIDASK